MSVPTAATATSRATPVPDDPWGPFADTVLRFAPPDGVCIDLRAPISPAQCADLAALGLDRPFCIITAQDPFGVTLDPGANERLTAQLRDDIAARGVPSVAVDAGSPDFSHTERSLAIVVNWADGVALAVEYRQLAIFWFDGEAFWIVPAVQRGPAVRLPRRARTGH